MQPMPTSPPKKRRVWLWIVGGIAGLLVCSCLVTAIAVGSHGDTNTSASQQITPTTTVASSRVPTTKPPTATAIKPVPTQVPTQIVATHGTPLFGGLYSDFIGKYGQPFNQGNAGSQDFYGDAAQTIIVNVTPENGKVTHMDITGPESWTASQTENYCTQFLPGDATAFNRTPPGSTVYVDYHSSLGEIVMSLLPQACLIYMGQN